MPTPKRVLMVAFHFPPLAGSSGIQRTLRFVQHLPSFGWQPVVLTADERAYERTSDDLMAAVPASIPVRRAFALDTARQLSWRGRYLGAMARPDRWVSWKFDAVRQGMRLIREFRPDALWSTYPIATAHLIGAELHRRSGLPWIADFRDPMAQEGYPSDPLTHRQYVDIEREATGRAALSVFTTPGAARVYAQRYPVSANRIVVIENGYDEDTFVEAERQQPVAHALQPGVRTLLHSGIVYPDERDPTALFIALRRLRDEGVVDRGTFRIRFRAAVHDDLLANLAGQHGVRDLIELLPPVGYAQALQEMRSADALLVMQASNCNEQIPGKLYEYLRARRPIVCLSDHVGDTATLLREAGVDAIAALDSVDEIAACLRRWVTAAPGSITGLARDDVVSGASRRSRTQLLAAHLDRLTDTAIRR